MAESPTDGRHRRRMTGRHTVSGVICLRRCWAAAAAAAVAPAVDAPTPRVALPGWDTFGVVIGGAAGALIGALFVSISIRIDVVSASPDFRSRGAATLALFMSVLLVAIVLVVPGQNRWELGAEIVVLAAALGGGLAWLDRRAAAQPSAQPISRVLAVVNPGAVTTILLAAAGVLLLAGVDDGVYVLIPAVVAAMAGGVASAWLFLTRIRGAP